MNIQTMLRNGVLIPILMILISGCATTDFVGVVENKPVAYPSEISIMPFPIKPPEGGRNNANMHNYRKRLEEWSCDTILLFDSFVTRITESQSVQIPVECIGIVSSERNYLILE